MNILQIFNELYLYLLVFLRMVVYFQTYISTFHECDSILTEKFRKAVDWEYTSEYSVDDPGMYSLYTHEKEKKLLAFCKKHLYPFGTLPTYILIDKKGKIASITERVAEEK